MASRRLVEGNFGHLFARICVGSPGVVFEGGIASRLVCRLVQGQ